MTSINFNSAANSALRTLQSSNAQLDATQNRISTGLKIADAKDNAAYWSISTTLKSDNKALGTVKDALNLGAASVDTAYQGLNETISILDEIKSKLTAATGGSVDKTKINAEVQELKKRLEAIAGASTFSGENWLKTDSSVASNVAKTIVSGFSRASNGAFSLDEIDINTTSVVLMDTRTSGTKIGLLDLGGFGDASTPIETVETNLKAAISTDLSAGSATVKFTIADASTYTATDKISFDISVNGSTKTVNIDKALLDANVAVAGTIDAGKQDDIIIAALTAAGFNAAATASSGVLGVAVTSGVVTITGHTDIKAIRIGNAQAFSQGTGTGVLGMSLSAATTNATIENMVSTVNNTIEKVTSAAATLGAIAARVTGQKSFVEGLMSTIDKGISGLVDADMNEESTKLQALQVKQQLGVQALSIANQSAQNVLSLFRS